MTASIGLVSGVATGALALLLLACVTQFGHHSTSSPGVRFMSRRLSSESSQSFDTEAAVNEIISKAFSDVKGPGSFFKSDVKFDVTWLKCTNINYTRAMDLNYHGALPAVSRMIEELSLDDCDPKRGVNRSDPTCLAIVAAIESTFELATKFPHGPKFANYSVVDWGRFPSWVAGSVGSVNNNVAPPTATLLDPNGVNGFFLCSLLRTILTQSPNQEMTGTCSYTAPLAALSRLAPARAIEMGMRLMWTGQATPQTSPPCAYIYDQQPGLVPFMYNGSVRPLGLKGNFTQLCAGSEQDCAVKPSIGRPQQESGLESMWTQSLSTGFLSFNWEGCSAKQMPVASIQYPGMSDSALVGASDVQGGSAASMIWVCNRVIDPAGESCKFSFNYGSCSFLSDEDCQELTEYPIDFNLMKYFNDTMVNLTAENNSTSFVEAGLQPLLHAYPVLANFTSLVKRVATKTNRTVDNVLNVWDSQAWLPSFTEDLLAKACTVPVAMLIIDALPLQYAAEEQHSRSTVISQLGEAGLPFFGSHVKLMNGTTISLPKSGECDHAVYLEKCDAHRNSYTIWSWGTTYTLSKEILLGSSIKLNQLSRTNDTYNTGMVCGAVLADAITA